jgi:hypothetical protein
MAKYQEIMAEAGGADTSGCEITVAQGQHVTKGYPMGKFHFGGSSHCLVFGPQVKLNWTGIPLAIAAPVASVTKTLMTVLSVPSPLLLA